MVILDWYGGHPKSVQRFGLSPKLLNFAIGVVAGNKIFGYTSDAWFLDFSFDEDDARPEIWIFDNEIPCDFFVG